ncbi:MAG: RnfABCDGE type electron transport complex subunit D, partial [Erysipelotrichaceae bacterium]|nr:RnfABCDGE type electron transport complex subunit D [Erysipelotrichaceae bacterium]
RLYVTGVASFISLFFGKLVFGGFGQNVFNPAAVGRTLILIGFGGGRLMDVIASPTPTTTIADNGWLLKASAMERFLNDFGGLKNMFMGNYFGAIGETSTLLILIIGVVLAALEVFDWMVPAVYLGCIFLGTFIIGFLNGVGMEYALFNIMTGGVAFGAVFMLTDPVTNPNTRSGRVVFAAIAAFITMLIRFRGSLPEGVGYTILLANILTPVIEKYFDGKTTDRMHKDLISVIVVLIAAVAGIVLVGLTLKANDYSSIMVLTDILKGGLL